LQTEPVQPGERPLQHGLTITINRLSC
jgi:hypothetical protein